MDFTKYPRQKKGLILSPCSRCLQHLSNTLRTVSLFNESERYALYLNLELSPPEEMLSLGLPSARCGRVRCVFAQVYLFFFPAHFQPTAVGIQAVKTTSALIAMSSSCIKTFLVKHHNLGGKKVSMLNQAGLE